MPLPAVGRLGDRAVSESSTALESNAEVSLLRLATDQADISDVVFEQVESEMNTLAGYAATVQALPGASSPRPLYSQSEPPQDPNMSSVYILAPGVTKTNVQDELFSLASMDDVMRPMLASDPRITQVYLGTGSGILYVHPWVTGISSSYRSPYP